MKSLRFRGGSEIDVVEVATPVPGPGQVTIDTVASALCGSELKGYIGAGSETGNSGHEAAGVVSALGAGVTSLQLGDRVGVSAIAGCGTAATASAVSIPGVRIAPSPPICMRRPS